MPKPENTQLRVFAYFLVVGAFCLKNCVPKNGFPVVFSRSGLGGGTIVLQIHFLKRPNTPEYDQDLVVTWAKPNSVTALLSPRPKSVGSINISKGFQSIGPLGRCFL